MLISDHVALVVRELEPLVQRFVVFGLEVGEIEEFPEEGTREVYLGREDEPGTRLPCMRCSPMRSSPMRSSILLALLSSCATDSPSSAAASPPSPGALHAERAVPVVEHWGAMREVLREGRTEGRIDLGEVLGPNTIAVGASAGLAAEITVLAGKAHLAEVVDPGSAQGLRVRAPAAGEQATLLVLTQVAEWSEHPLGALPDLASLEASVRAIAVANNIDVTRPFAFRVEGVAGTVHLHVINHSCPIAQPDGPQPWRFFAEGEPIVLVGFYAEDSAGRLTHLRG